MLAANDQIGNGECTVKVLGHVAVGPNAVAGRIDCWDGLCEWASRGSGPYMLVCLEHDVVCC